MVVQRRRRSVVVSNNRRREEMESNIGGSSFSVQVILSILSHCICEKHLFLFLLLGLGSTASNCNHEKQQKKMIPVRNCQFERKELLCCVVLCCAMLCCAQKNKYE
jgi:hypothetical protein